jgi:hypothetical protein
MLDSFLDLRQDTVAGLDFPFVELNSQSILPQPLRQRANYRFVLRAVAEKDIE